MEELIEFINRFRHGVSAGEIERHFKLSRTTLNRRLKEALQAGTLLVTGKGPATLYHKRGPVIRVASLPCQTSHRPNAGTVSRNIARTRAWLVR